MVGCVCCVRCITLGFCIDISWFQANIYILYRQSMRQISPIYHIFKQEKWGKYRNISEISPLLALILLWLATLALNNVKFGWSSCADLQYRFIPPFMSILCRSRLHLGVPSKCGQEGILKSGGKYLRYIYIFSACLGRQISRRISRYLYKTQDRM